MEQLNRIELRGNVGLVKLQRVGDRVAARFSLATNYAYKDKEGNAVIETTWHNITAWQGKGISDLATLQKGSKVYLIGRVRNQRFTNSDGEEQFSNEVIAKNLSILQDDNALQCEF